MVSLSESLRIYGDGSYLAQGFVLGLIKLQIEELCAKHYL